MSDCKSVLWLGLGLLSVLCNKNFSFYLHIKLYLLYIITKDTIIGKNSDLSAIQSSFVQIKKGMKITEMFDC